ncbi:nucleotidyltransferase family protein [Aliarcobacter cryaerophilus]|jgi:predicted nucleotidyltransferase|uniref:Nucleotidyltransferase domain-containing protein n=2 Tax=unclassified Arcobacter TaxID=2593671 RepID=A0AA96DBV3_9BACT|nr:nucleotidyltransferase domain-containing protein [Arcobacter sp. AZ-2023]WPD09024.1 nucleotidyltransferase domain-containing protein [Arcobacter sp. DSM 115954]WNL13856.1 nucleotidyltransferase domain-containing protein [Arcobacter sp. AZ-2023]WNL18138.1 nucleotidyltransferase domain-containing protein [Arcobacter sp. AZ-2023]WNL20273.1 nucleotidyltransferase domain-containing protein [Arcobacter sp. AZ-2023]
MINSNEIILKLKELKPIYEKEGMKLIGIFGSFAKNSATENSDIDILYELDTKKFYEKNSGFKSFLRIKEIKEELQNIFKRDIDLCAKSGLSNTGEKYILGNTVYV